MTTNRRGQPHRNGYDQAEEKRDEASLSGVSNGLSSNKPFDYNSKATFCIDRLKWISNKNQMKKTRAASATNNIPRKDWDEIPSALKSGFIKSVTHSSSITEHISYVIEDPISGKFHSTWNMPNEELKASAVNNPEDDDLLINDKILLWWISQSKKVFLFTCGTLAGISLGVENFHLSFICNTICLTGVILLCSLPTKSSSHHHFFSTSSHSVNFILNLSYTVSLVLTLSMEKSKHHESDTTKVLKSILCVLSWFIIVAYTLK